MEDGIQGRIFETFFTIKITAETAGINPYIGREIVLNYKGTITAKSEKYKYSEFTITIPI
jgi:signal transduction histidine kinase